MIIHIVVEMLPVEVVNQRCPVLRDMTMTNNLRTTWPFLLSASALSLVCRARDLELNAYSPTVSRNVLRPIVRVEAPDDEREVTQQLLHWNEIALTDPLHRDDEASTALM